MRKYCVNPQNSAKEIEMKNYIYLLESESEPKKINLKKLKPYIPGENIHYTIEDLEKIFKTISRIHLEEIVKLKKEIQNLKQEQRKISDNFKKPKKLNNDDIKKLLEQKQDGLSNRQIAKFFKVDESTIRNYLKEINVSEKAK